MGPNFVFEDKTRAHYDNSLNLDEAEELSDRICILHKGRIILTESVEKLKARHEEEKLEDIFLRFVEEERRKGPLKA